MQRVSAFLPWEKRNSGASRTKSAGPGLSWWSSAASNSNRASTSTTASANGPNGLAGINTLVANSDNGRVRREAFWPANLELECDKAARIIKSFCCDGYLSPVDDQQESQIPTESTEPSTPIKVTKKIPRRIIQNAAGIAVFTCMRSGLWMTGSGGSGILIARKSDGTWSPPSAIMLHTPTLSFIIGVDVYDCVLVINNLAALESMTRPRLTLGEDVGLTGGPLVALDSNEVDLRWKDLGNTVFTYMKARGQHQLVNLNGCILTERGNENERFYSSNVTQMDILSGNVARHVDETKPLFDVIRMAEGRTDFDAAIIEKLAAAPAPGDAVIATPKSTPASPRNAFGVPSNLDPDPFGILALEMAGLEIREAGTRMRPASSQLEFNPAPSSPALSKFNRQSVETFTTRSNRGSVMSTHTTKSQVTDAGTQTDVGKTPETTPSPGQSEASIELASFERAPEPVREDDEEVDYTTVDLTPLRHISQSSILEVPEVADAARTEQDDTKLVTPSSPEIEKASLASSNYGNEDEEEDKEEVEEEDDEDEDDDNDHENNITNDADDEDDEDDDEEEEPVTFEVAQAQPTRSQAAVASRMIHAKAGVVTIPKRLPPPLPARSPARYSRSSRSDMGGDVSALKSPLRQEFGEMEGKAADVVPMAAVAGDDGPGEMRLEVPVQTLVEEAQVEEAKAEESKPEETKAEETEVEQIKSEETKPEETKPEETKPEVSKAEEAQPEDIKPELHKAEGIKSEEVQPEETKPELHKAEGIKSEEAQPEETKLEDSDIPATPVVEITEAVKVHDSEGEASSADEAVEELVTNHKTEISKDSQAENLTEVDSGIPSSQEESNAAELKGHQLANGESSAQEAEEETKTNGQKANATAEDKVEDSFVEDLATEELKDDAASQKTVQSEQSDNSDSTSNKKHSSSIFTGATEDRWSAAGSSLTTPTSDRPFSALDDATGDDTPTKEKDTEPEVQNAGQRQSTPTAAIAG